MKKIAALVETTPDRVPTVKSVSVFSVQQQQKSSASNTRNKACHKPSKVITMNVSGGNSKEIFELFTNKQGRRPRMLNAGAEGVLDQ